MYTIANTLWAKKKSFPKQLDHKQLHIPVLQYNKVSCCDVVRSELSDCRVIPVALCAVRSLQQLTVAGCLD